MDWIGHHNDIAHWALGLDASGPTRVEAVGWTKPRTDIYDTPHHYAIHCEFAGGVRSVISSRLQLGAKLIGDQGWVHVTRGKLTASDDRWRAPELRVETPEPIYRSPGHMRNFLDYVKSRRQCVAPPETAHRSITPGHLAYVSHTVGRPLAWDPQRQQIVADADADRLLRHVGYREPWRLGG